MTSYPDAQTGYGAPAQAAPVRRPGTLSAAIIVAVVAGLAAIVDGVIILAGGRDLVLTLATQAVADLTGESVESVKQSAGAILDAAIDDATATVHLRAVMLIAFGVLTLLFGALLRGGALWARILVTLSALANALIALAVATDLGTPAITGLAWAAVAGSLIAIVLAWLPANHRYAKARKGL